MSEMEEKLGAILNNPQMMQQIMAMAQALGGGQPQTEEPPKQQKPADAPATGTLPNLDPKILQSLAGMANQRNIDQNQQALLRALSPYLSRDRISKLERAMQAARMAGAASMFINSGGLQLLTGR